MRATDAAGHVSVSVAITITLSTMATINVTDPAMGVMVSRGDSDVPINWTSVEAVGGQDLLEAGFNSVIAGDFVPHLLKREMVENKFTYHREGMREGYVNSPYGIKQTFVFGYPPTGENTLIVDILVRGDVTPPPRIR